MSAVLEASEQLVAQITRQSAMFGRKLNLNARSMIDRSHRVELGPSQKDVSPNGTCRLFQTSDGWIAVNLPRPDDESLIPAWLRLDDAPNSNKTLQHIIKNCVVENQTEELVSDAILLGLAVAGVGECKRDILDPALIKLGSPRPSGIDFDRPLRVLDLTSLWAGPLCSSLFAQMGNEVIAIKDARWDAVQNQVFARPKPDRVLDVPFKPDYRDALLNEIRNCDVIISSARIRAYRQMGLCPSDVFNENPNLVWVAVSGHGWNDQGDRAGFGDDCAAAGGLLSWDKLGRPRFAGDAPADPLTGLAAFSGGLTALSRGGGFLVDAALSKTAAAASRLKRDLGAPVSDEVSEARV